MPMPPVKEPTEEEEAARVEQQKGEMEERAAYRESQPYSPKDFWDKIASEAKFTIYQTAQMIEQHARALYGRSPFPKGNLVPVLDEDGYPVINKKTGKIQNRRVPFDPHAMANYVAPKMVEDILWQLQQPFSGEEWYQEDLKYVRKVLPHIYPEMQGHPELEKLYWMLLGPTSFGSDAKVNFSAAHNIFMLYLKTGKLYPRQPISQKVAGKVSGKAKGWTSRGEEVARAVTRIDTMIKENGGGAAGINATYDWLQAKHPLSELVAARGGTALNPGTEDYDTAQGKVAYGSMIFGPKGGSFFLNLIGNMEPLTADMWFTRSWGRYLGDVTEVASDVGSVEARTGHAKIPRSEWPKEVAERPLGDPPAILRPAMREAIKIVSREVSKAMGREVTPAECQAALWYYEQGLWGVMGAKTLGFSFQDGVEWARRRRYMDAEAERRGWNPLEVEAETSRRQKLAKDVARAALLAGKADEYSPSPTAREEDAVADVFGRSAESSTPRIERTKHYPFLTHRTVSNEAVFERALRLRLRRAPVRFVLQ
jgi:hypothetical protein